MRNSALAALLTATPALAAAQCVEVKQDPNIDPAMQPTYAKYADTAHCFLRIDGKVIINRTCRISISGDTAVYAMDGIAEAWRASKSEPTGRPYYRYFCRAKNATGSPRISAANLSITVALSSSTPGKSTFAGATIYVLFAAVPDLRP
jgi:hypothetical protein